VLIEIEDDGAGITPERSDTAEIQQVRGMQLIRQRVEAYNQLHTHPIHVNIAPRKAGGGTMVSLSFPLGN
jgi:nitrate/nitrite-specific signal transduction histidine kinase